MFYPTKYHWLEINRSAKTAQPPPAHGRSATVFVSKVLLGAIGMCALITLIASAPTRVTFPLGFVFVAYALGVAVASLAERHRGAIKIPRASTTRMSLVSSVHEQRESNVGASPLSAAWFALVIGSLALLCLAFVVPAEFGTRFAASGLVGLLILRLAAIHGRRASGGSAWTTSERPLENPRTQYIDSPSRDRRIARWPRRQPDGPPAYDRRRSSTHRR